MNKFMFFFGIFWFVIVSIAGFNLSTHTEDSPCYDSKGSLINELTCEKEVQEYFGWWLLALFLSVAVVIFGMFKEGGNNV